MKAAVASLLLVVFLTAYSAAHGGFQTGAAGSAPLVKTGRKLFAERCANCHGPEAEGTDEGPALIGNRRSTVRTQQQLRRFIFDGKISAGMPAFHLPGPELDALSAFVHSLSIPAAESPIDGSFVRGEAFFFGEGQCASCHMVRGYGKAIGPDLSDVALRMTTDEIRQVLLHPETRITPGYEMVDVRLRNGQTVRGFARGRTNFDIQLQDLEGRFHMFRDDQIAGITGEKNSGMKPIAATREQTRNLLVFLSRLSGETPILLPPLSPSETGGSDLDFERIKQSKPGEWLTYNGNLNGNRYSELKEINVTNVSKLVVKWMFSVDHFGLEVTPLVADGLMYITGPNQAIALDAATGRVVWGYSRSRTPGLLGDASLGSNRGLAILGDKVFMVTDNAHLIALNRVTGALVWDVYMPEEPMHYGSTVAPLVVNDTVIAGVSGGDRGIRGFLACYKAETGERVWRRWTVPMRGETARETWGAKEPARGGAATWLTGAYDASTDTLFWPTGNPYPDSEDGGRPGDNLYSNCILAMHPHTGALKWYYQFTPHDVHDWDAT